MKKILSCSIIALCVFTMHAADNREDLIHQLTDKQKQEIPVRMLMGHDIPNHTGQLSADAQSRFQEMIHPQGKLIQILRPMHFDAYQIIIAEGLDDTDRVAAYTSLHIANIYHTLSQAMQPIIPSKEEFDAQMLSYLVAVSDTANTDAFNDACKAHIKRLNIIYRIHKEHNSLPVTQETFNELFDKSTQLNPLEQEKLCNRIDLLTQALQEQIDDHEHENSLVSVFKQQINETLEEFLKIHSPQ